jgi:hypothetical protein
MFCNTDDTGKLVIKLMFIGSSRAVGPVVCNELQVRGRKLSRNVQIIFIVTIILTWRSWVGLFWEVSVIYMTCCKKGLVFIHSFLIYESLLLSFHSRTSDAGHHFACFSTFMDIIRIIVTVMSHQKMYCYNNRMNLEYCQVDYRANLSPVLRETIV